MYNRYQGNTGKVVRVQEGTETKRSEHKSNPMPVPSKVQPHPQPRPRPTSDPVSSISSLLQNSLGGLETDDIILLLILYLMYRESGDSDLLVIMGAMFLL